MRKFVGLVVTALLLLGLAKYAMSAATNIMTGFNQDVDRVMNFSSYTTVDPEHPIISALPQTTKAVVKEGDAVGRFFQVLMWSLLAAGVLFVVGLVYWEHRRY